MKNSPSSKARGIYVLNSRFNAQCVVPAKHPAAVWTTVRRYAFEPRSGGIPVAAGVKPVDPHCQAVERQRRDRR